MLFSQSAELVCQCAFDGIDKIGASLQSLNVDPVRRRNELGALKGNLINDKVDYDLLHVLCADDGNKPHRETATVFVFDFNRPRSGELKSDKVIHVCLRQLNETLQSFIEVVPCR